MSLKHICAALIAACAVCSCDLVMGKLLPFTISGFVIENAAEQDTYHTAGAKFWFRNTAEKDAARVELSFRIYYDDGSYPCYGNNRVAVTLSGIILAGEEELITVPLDEYIQIFRDKPFVADHIFVEKIVYRDGTTWSDSLGVWQTGGRQ